MAYTVLSTFTDTLATSNDFNAYVRDNQRALKDPPSQNYEPNEASNYSGSGSTWANVDTDLNFSLTTTGGDVIVCFQGTVLCLNAGFGAIGLIDVSVDGTRIVNETSGGLIAWYSRDNVSLCYRITGLSAGVHNFNLQWKAIDNTGTLLMYAGAGTAGFDVHPQFWVRELT